MFINLGTSELESVLLYAWIALTSNISAKTQAYFLYFCNTRYLVYPLLLLIQ